MSARCEGLLPSRDRWSVSAFGRLMNSLSIVIAVIVAIGAVVLVFVPGLARWLAVLPCL